MLLCIHGNTERGDTMKRDMKKIIEQTKVPNGYQLACSEWLQLSHHAARGGRRRIRRDLRSLYLWLCFGYEIPKEQKSPRQKTGAGIAGAIPVW